MPHCGLRSVTGLGLRYYKSKNVLTRNLDRKVGLSELIGRCILIVFAASPPGMQQIPNPDRVTW